MELHITLILGCRMSLSAQQTMKNIAKKKTMKNVAGRAPFAADL